MIKVFTAITFELDDAALALSEILATVKKDDMCRYSVGILSYCPEFVSSGIVKKICNEMPFDTIGCTTNAVAANGGASDLACSLTVLTSDDVEFSVGFTRLSEDEPTSQLLKAYNAAAGGRKDSPSLVVAIASILDRMPGEQIVGMLNALSDEAPVFGTLAAADMCGDIYSGVVYNGEVCEDGAAMILFYGECNPRFFVESISDSNIHKQRGIINRADGNVIMEVNEQTFLEYMDGIGLVKNGKVTGKTAVPLIVDYNDGTMPVARSLYTVTPEGYGICGGVMPRDASITVGMVEHDDVVKTAKALMSRLEKEKASGALIVSCLTRYLALESNIYKEMETVSSFIKGSLPFSMLYSGGEISPVCGEHGQNVNRFHNVTIAACVFD